MGTAPPDLGELRLSLPKATRLAFAEARASISRRAGDRVVREEALRVLISVYMALSEAEATRLVRIALGKFSQGRVT